MAVVEGKTEKTWPLGRTTVGPPKPRHCVGVTIVRGLIVRGAWGVELWDDGVCVRVCTGVKFGSCGSCTKLAGCTYCATGDD